MPRFATSLLAEPTGDPAARSRGRTGRGLLAEASADHLATLASLARRQRVAGRCFSGHHRQLLTAWPRTFSRSWTGTGWLHEAASLPRTPKAALARPTERSVPSRKQANVVVATLSKA